MRSAITLSDDRQVLISGGREIRMQATKVAGIFWKAALGGRASWFRGNQDVGTVEALYHVRCPSVRHLVSSSTTLAGAHRNLRVDSVERDDTRCG